MEANAGFEVGEYLEIVPNERIVRAEIYEGEPDAGAVSTVSFTEQDGRTRLSILVRPTSTQNREMQTASGMEAGMQESLDLFEQVAASLG